MVECRTRNRESPSSNPPLLPFRRLGIFRSLHRRPSSLSCINEYLAIDSGGNVSDLVLARNCCLARMLPGESENGVGMNRSVREGNKCEALWAVRRTGYCAIYKKNFTFTSQLIGGTTEIPLLLDYFCAVSLALYALNPSAIIFDRSIHLNIWEAPCRAMVTWVQQ